MGYTDEQKTAIANSIRSGNVGSSTPTSSSGGGTGGYTDEQKTAIANAIRSGQGSVNFTNPTQTTVSDILADQTPATPTYSPKVQSYLDKQKQIEQSKSWSVDPRKRDPLAVKGWNEWQSLIDEELAKEQNTAAGMKAISGTAGGADVAQANRVADYLASIPMQSTDNFLLPYDLQKVSDFYQPIADSITAARPENKPLQSTDNFLPANMEAVFNAYQAAVDKSIAGNTARAAELKAEYEAAPQKIANIQSQIDAVDNDIADAGLRLENAIFKEDIDAINAELTALGERKTDLMRQKAEAEAAQKENPFSPEYRSEEQKAQTAKDQEKLDALVKEGGHRKEIIEMLRANPDLTAPASFRLPMSLAGALQKGLTGIATAGAGVVDFTGIGDIIDEAVTMFTGYELNPMQAWTDSIRKENQMSADYYANATRGGALSEGISDYGAQIIQALPALALAMYTGGSSLYGTSLADTAAIAQMSGAQQSLALVGEGVKTMSARPDFILSFMQESGNSYNSAIEEGMTDTEASVYAMLYGYLAAAVEVGGTSENLGGLQEYYAEMKDAAPTTVKEHLMKRAKEIVSEIGEENVQGMLERGTRAFFGVDTALVSNDPNQNAIIKPLEMLEEAKGAGIVSAVLGLPGDIQAGRAIRAANSQTNTNTQTNAPTAQQVADNAPAVTPATVEQIITPAQQALLDTISNGVTNKVAETIMNNPALKAEFERIADVSIEGTKSEQRNIVKNNADAVVSALTESAPAVDAAVAEEAPAVNEESITEKSPAEEPAQEHTEEKAEEGINTPTETETEESSLTQEATEEKTGTEEVSEEREFTKAQEKLGDLLGLGAQITNEEIDSILDNRSLRRAMESFGFTFENGTLSEQRQTVRDFAAKIAKEGIPSEKEVAKMRQDAGIQSNEQSLQYQIDKLQEELDAAELRGDIEKRKALAKQLNELKAKQKRTKTLGKIRKVAKDLSSMLTNPKENKYVPADLADDTMDFVESLYQAMTDPDSQTKTAQRAAQKLANLSQKFDAIKNAEARIVDGVEIAEGAGYDADVAKLLDGVREMLAETPLNELTDTDLESVQNAIEAVNFAIKNGRSIEIKGKSQEISALSKEATRLTKEAKGADNALTKYSTLMERPETFFNKLGGWVKDNVWHRLYNMLDDGQTRSLKLKSEVGEQFKNLIKNPQYKTLREKITLKNLTDTNGDSVPITRGMALSLLFHLNNEQNTRHIANGGITASGNINDYNRGRHDRGFGRGSINIEGISPEMSDLNYQYNQAKADGNTELMEEIQGKRDALETKETEHLDKLREEIESNLTPYERDFVKQAQEFFQWAQDNLNKTTKETYGFVKATVDNYFPIDTDADYRGRTLDEQTSDPSLENIKIMQRRTNSGSPIRLLDITDVLNNYTNQMARFCGIMPAVKKFNQVYEAQLRGYKGGAKKAVGDQFGTTGQKYIDNLIKDLQGTRKSDGGILQSMLATTRGNFAASVLTLNPRVAFAQAPSYLNAASVLGWDNLAKGLVMKNADPELIAEYSEKLRSRDNRSPDFNNRTDWSSRRNRITKKLGFLLNWINNVDNKVVQTLWSAAESYVNQNFDLAEGTDAYYKEVAKVFDEAVNRTQPGYEVMQRPDILRNPDSLTRTLTMFMTQRLQNFNEVYDRIAQAQKYFQDFKDGKNGVTKADVAAANKAATNSVTGVVASSLALTVMKAAIDGLLHRTKNYRDKDTGELTTESTLLRILDYTAESLASTVLGGAELYRLGHTLISGNRYYGTSVPGVETISDMTENIINAFRASEEKRPDAMLKAAGSVAQVFGGIPLDNAKGFVEAAIHWAEDFQENSRGILESDYEYTVKQNENAWYAAVLSGDYEKADMIEQQRMGDKARQEATDITHEHFKAGDIDYKQAKDFLMQAGYDADDADDKVLDWHADSVYDTSFDKWQKDRDLTYDNSDLGRALARAKDSPDFKAMDEGQQNKALGSIYSFYKHLAKKEFAEENGIEYENDTYEKIEQLSNPVEAIVRSKLWNDAVKNDDYDAINALISSVEDMSDEGREYFEDKNHVKKLEAASELKEPIYAKDYFEIHDIASEWAKNDTEMKQNGIDNRDYDHMDDIVQALIPLFTDDDGKVHADTVDVFNGTYSHFDELIEAAQIGIDAKTWYDIRDEYVRLTNDDSKKGTLQHTDINNFIDTYPGLTAEQKALLKEHSTVFQTMAVQNNVYDKMVAGGADPDVAYGIYTKISELEPLPDKEDVTANQKAHVVLDDPDLSKTDKVNILLNTDGATIKPNQGDLARWLLANFPQSVAESYWNKFKLKFDWKKPISKAKYA